MCPNLSMAAVLFPGLPPKLRQGIPEDNSRRRVSWNPNNGPLSIPSRSIRVREEHRNSRSSWSRIRSSSVPGAAAARSVAQQQTSSVSTNTVLGRAWRWKRASSDGSGYVRGSFCWRCDLLPGTMTLGRIRADRVHPAWECKIRAEELYRGKSNTYAYGSGTRSIHSSPFELETGSEHLERSFRG